IRVQDNTRPPSVSGAQWSPFDPATAWFSGLFYDQAQPPALARDSVPLGTLVTRDPGTETGGPVPVVGGQGGESPKPVTASSVSSSGGRGSGHLDGTTAAEGGQALQRLPAAGPIRRNVYHPWLYQSGVPGRCQPGD